MRFLLKIEKKKVKLLPGNEPLFCEEWKGSFLITGIIGPCKNNLYEKAKARTRKYRHKVAAN